MLIFKLSILFTLGVIVSTIMNKARIPDVLAYITTGIILGPSFLNLFTYGDAESLNMINQFALCLVGFLICKSLNFKELKKSNFSILYISIIEGVATFVVVFLVCFLLCGQSMEFSIILAAISSASAPVIPLIVLRQFKARGELTSAIMPVIAIDDIICVMLFYFTLSIAKSGTSGEPLGALLSEYFLMLLITAALGIAIGLVCALLFNFLLKNKEEHLILAVGICFACVGIAQILDLQPTILAMAVGITVANTSRGYENIFDGLYLFAPPVFLAFFVATSSIIVIDVYYIINIGFVGLAYLLARTAGKLAGSYIGARIFKYGGTVKKYLGSSILAQAGVVLIMSDIIRAEIPAIGEQIYVIIRGGCFIFLIVGPLLTKFSIGKAKEIYSE